MPFEKVMGRVLEFNPGDTFFLDELELPEGSIILANEHQRLSYKSTGKTEVHFVDFSKEGEKLSGLQVATYEEMIRLGYFPQFVSPRGDWIGWSNTNFDTLQVWGGFCQRNGLSHNISSAPHDFHWTGQMENVASCLQFYQEEANYRRMQETIEFGKRLLEKPEIPEKYRTKLQTMLREYQR